MKKKIIITVCMAMTVLTGLAQSPLSFHAKAGIGTSHFHEDKRSYRSSRCKRNNSSNNNS